MTDNTMDFADHLPTADWRHLREANESITPMTEQELIEQLADAEHLSWARWMNYLFLKCGRQQDGSVIIPPDLVERWQRQIETPYSALSEAEKQSDREEVKCILPMIHHWHHPRPLVARQTLRDVRGLCDWLETH